MSRFIPPHIRTKQKEKTSQKEQIEQARRQLESFAEAWEAVCNHLENQLYTPHGIRAYTGFPPFGREKNEYINEFLSLWTDNYLRLGSVLVENGVADCFDEHTSATEKNSVEECARHFVANVTWHAIQGDRESVATALKEAYEFGGDFYSEVRKALSDAKGHSAWVLRDRLAAAIGIPSLGLAPPLVVSSPPEVSTEGTDADKPEAEQAEGSAKRRRKRRGRPSDTDHKADQCIYDAWQTKQYKTYDALAQERRITKYKVELALGRHRARLRRDKQKRLENDA
jgi:hypothetical protein